MFVCVFVFVFVFVLLGLSGGNKQGGIGGAFFGVFVFVFVFVLLGLSGGNKQGGRDIGTSVPGYPLLPTTLRTAETCLPGWCVLSGCLCLCVCLCLCLFLCCWDCRVGTNREGGI